jgi:hypothetical protein
VLKPFTVLTLAIFRKSKRCPQIVNKLWKPLLARVSAIKKYQAIFGSVPKGSIFAYLLKKLFHNKTQKRL